MKCKNDDKSESKTTYWIQNRTHQLQNHAAQNIITITSLQQEQEMRKIGCLGQEKTLRAVVASAGHAAKRRRRRHLQQQKPPPPPWMNTKPPLPKKDNTKRRRHATSSFRYCLHQTRLPLPPSPNKDNAATSANRNL